VSVIAVIAVLLVTAQRVNRALEQKQIADALITAAFERLAVRTDYIRTGSERARAQVIAENQKIDNLLRSASDKFKDPKEKLRISTLIENQQSIGRILQAIIANREDTERGVRNAALSGEVEARLLTQLNARVYELVIVNGKLQESSSAALVSALKTAGAGGVLILLLVSAVTLINSALMNRTIVDRIGRLRDGASAIGQGHLDHRINIKGDDEFAALSAEFDGMTVKLRNSYTSLANEVEERKRAEEKIRHQNKIQETINRIFEKALTCDTEEELGRMGLSVAEELTDSKFGFIGEIGQDGCLHDIAISDPGWELCTMYDKTGHRRPPGNFKIHGLYGRVLLDGSSLLVNDPSSHPDSIGIPEGHPQLTAFLGVPFIQKGKAIGMVAMGNREHGYTQEQQQDLEAVVPAIFQTLLSKRADEELRQVRDRALWLARFPEQNPNPVIRTSADGTVLYYNPASTKVEGWKYEVGQVLTNELLGLVARAMAEGREVQEDVLLAGRFYIVWIAPFPAEGYANVYGRDITERKRMEEELQKTHKELQEHATRLEAANRELESFSYSVSHDLRSPLRAIDGFTRMILNDKGAGFDEETRRKFGIVQDNAQKMGHLIDDLLRLSRVGRANLNWSKLDMKALASEALQEIRTAEPQREFKAEIRDLPKAQGDPAMIRQLLVNLMSNAVKFTRGKEDGRIEVGSFEQSGEKVYYVRDNGIGFDMKYYNKLFGVFQRLVSESQFEGTGVGLAIVQRIVQRHGGRIWAEGKIHEGATFYFTLP